MKTMNYESSKWSREAIDDVPVDEEELVRRRKRRRIIVAVVLIALVLVAAYLLMGRGGSGAAPQKGAAGAAAARANGQMPTVSFVIPVRQEVPIMISATGSLGAVRDMPVGVPGEGGRIVRVLVEPGQSVGAGQVLAVIDRSVQ